MVLLKPPASLRIENASLRWKNKCRRSEKPTILRHARSYRSRIRSKRRWLGSWLSKRRKTDATRSAWSSRGLPSRSKCSNSRPSRRWTWRNTRVNSRRNSLINRQLLLLKSQLKRRKLHRPRLYLSTEAVEIEMLNMAQAMKMAMVERR